jgi:hypothetical protein
LKTLDAANDILSLSLSLYSSVFERSKYRVWFS